MIATKSSPIILSAMLVFVGLLSSPLEARPARSGQVPNGTTFGCVMCHVSGGGGGPRNAFGLQIEADFLSQAGFAGIVLWGPELAALDADGDGATNGEELGDPEGVWQAGDPNPAGDIFLPWDAESTPPPPPAPEPTAVEETGWARIKSLIAWD